MATSTITQWVEAAAAHQTEFLVMRALEPNPSDLRVDEPHVGNFVVCYFLKFTRGCYFRKKECENRQFYNEFHIFEFYRKNVLPSSFTLSSEMNIN